MVGDWRPEFVQNWWKGDAPRAHFRRFLGVSGMWVLVLVFTGISLLPAFRRILHPTVLGDDITRLVDLTEHPLRELLFRPFNEHVAPVFEMVSWSTWQAIGHDLRLAPVGFCIASVLPWIGVLVLLGMWLRWETGSSTATLIALAMAAQSPLVLETLWWYSASSFSVAAVGVMTAILGASLLPVQPRWALLLVAIGSALGPAGSAIGLLAAPLSVLQALLNSAASWRRKRQAILVAVAGLATYLIVCALAGTNVLSTARKCNEGIAEPLTGLGYALNVPGRLLWPAMLGVPPTWTTKTVFTGLAWLLGLLALLILSGLIVKPRATWNRRLVLIGSAMIYLAYAITYCSRAGMVRLGHWTEPELLYLFAERYHLLPLLGACTVISAVLAALPLVRRCDTLRGGPLKAGIIAGLLALSVNRREVNQWTCLMTQPDQMLTFHALYRVGEVAKHEGITRDQLTRLFDPVIRDWNECLRDSPNFHFMKLVEQAPTAVARPLRDDEARARLLSHLTVEQQLVLGAGAAVSMRTVSPLPDGKPLNIARRVKLKNVLEFEPGHYRAEGSSAVVEYEMNSPADARFLSLPGLATDQDVKISWSDGFGQWRRRQQVYWLKKPRPQLEAAIDLSRLVNWPIGQRVRIRVEFNCPGDLALQQPELRR
jgi:hypothetical protein